MAKSPPSEIFYAPGPDGGPPEMDPPLYIDSTAEEAPPAPGDIQWCYVNGSWLGYPVGLGPKPEPEPEEEFPRYMPDCDGGPPCGGRVPVRAVPIDSPCTSYCSDGCCDVCCVEEAPPPPPDRHYCTVTTCATSCCGHSCDAPPPPLEHKKAAPKEAPPPPPPISPCSTCSSSCCSSSPCSTCPSSPCSECSPKPEPEKVVIKVKRTNRADVPRDEHMQYLGPDSVMTTINLIHGDHRPWEHPKVLFDFSTYEIDSAVSIRTLIKRLGLPEGFGVCESVELGNGTWIQADSYVPVDRKAFVEQNKKAFGQLSEDALKTLSLDESCDKMLEEVGWEGKVVWLLKWK